MKTKSSCASDRSGTLANGFFGVKLYQFGTCLGISSLGHLVMNCFYLFTYFLCHYHMMFTAACKLEIPCEWEIL